MAMPQWKDDLFLSSFPKQGPYLDTEWKGLQGTLKISGEGKTQQNPYTPF